MVHPLLEDVRGISDEELNKKIIKMNKILGQTYHNLQLYNQATTIINILLAEQHERAEKKFQKFLEKSNNKLSDTIDIN
jgi:ABC-type branched-subunit amino acid transport system ATPase component